jgi:hypothetical protein
MEITTRQAADEQQLSTMCASSSRLVFDIVELEFGFHHANTVDRERDEGDFN